jgi:hypothetical protein
MMTSGKRDGFVRTSIMSQYWRTKMSDKVQNILAIAAFWGVLFILALGRGYGLWPPLSFIYLALWPVWLSVWQ